MFKVKVERERYFDAAYILVTHNGFQWASISVYNIDEAKAIIHELIAYFGVEVMPDGL